MAFLAPLAAKAAPFILGALKSKGGQQVATTVGSSLLGSKLAGGSGGVPDTKNLLNEQIASIRQGRDVAASLHPEAQNLLSLATRSYSPVANYYGRLLSGNRASTMEAMSPEVQRINEGYDAQSRATDALTPRGGARSAFFGELPFQRTRDISNLLATSRPGAAQGLLRTGSEAGSTAQGLYSALLNALTGASSTTSNLLNYDLLSRQQQYGRGKELGSTIFDILQKIPFGKGKGSSPSGPSDFPIYFPGG